MPYIICEKGLRRSTAAAISLYAFSPYYTHTYIYTYKDFAGGGTLGSRPTINLSSFIRGRRSRAFPASIIPYATGSVPPFTVHIYIYLSPLYPEGFPKNSGPPRSHICRYCVRFAAVESAAGANRGPLPIELLFARRGPHIA